MARFTMEPNSKEGDATLDALDEWIESGKAPPGVKDVRRKLARSQEERRSQVTFEGKEFDYILRALIEESRANYPY